MYTAISGHECTEEPGEAGDAGDAGKKSEEGIRDSHEWTDARIDETQSINIKFLGMFPPTFFFEEFFLLKLQGCTFLVLMDTTEMQMTEPIRFRRIALCIDECIKMLREANRAKEKGDATWVGDPFISKVDFQSACGGKKTCKKRQAAGIDTPKESEDMENTEQGIAQKDAQDAKEGSQDVKEEDGHCLIRQIILARRDFAGYLDKTFRPHGKILVTVTQWKELNGNDWETHTFSFRKREDYMDGYTSDTETLPLIEQFVDKNVMNDKVFHHITRISLLFHIMRNRFRALKTTDNRYIITADDILAPIPGKYGKLAGFLDKNTDQPPIPILTLAVLARRSYRSFLQKEQYPMEPIILAAKKAWETSWDKNAPLEERCSDNEDEWEDLDDTTHDALETQDWSDGTYIESLVRVQYWAEISHVCSLYFSILFL